MKVLNGSSGHYDFRPLSSAKTRGGETFDAARASAGTVDRVPRGGVPLNLRSVVPFSCFGGEGAIRLGCTRQARRAHRRYALPLVGAADGQATGSGRTSSSSITAPLRSSTLRRCHAGTRPTRRLPQGSRLRPPLSGPSSSGVRAGGSVGPEFPPSPGLDTSPSSADSLRM